MDISGKIVVVTGGADGIGAALARRFHADGAKAVVVADLNEAGARKVAGEIGGLAFRCDVSKEADLQRVVEETEARLGPIDLFCSNAGVADLDKPDANVADATDAQWDRSWRIHVMAHIYAARILVPRMKTRGGGYFLNTISAAGLLTQLGNSVYATTKHASVGFSESLAITHRDDNIRVTVLCPQGVDTPLLRAGGRGPQHLDGVLTAEETAAAAAEAIREERFLCLPHPQVLGYMRNKTTDYERWIGGMAKLQRRLKEGTA